MNGLPTFQKRMNSLRRQAARRSTTVTTNTSVYIGSWIIEEDERGNLVIRHQDSEDKTILSRPPEHNGIEY